MTTVFATNSNCSNEVDTFLESVDISGTVNDAFTSFVVLPGDDVTAQIQSYMNRCKKPMNVSIGRGLQQIELSNDVVNIKTNIGGEIKYRHPNYFWVEPTAGINGCGGCDHITRYIPTLHDQVVGIVEDKGVDHYRININSIGPVFCSRLAFEGATKRNRPELRKGSVIYGKLINVDYKNSEMEMTCKVVGGSGLQKDWNSGESIYGELGGGHVVHVSVAAARYLLTPDCIALHALAKHFAFEIVIGLNGAIWVHTGPTSTSQTSVLNTILVRNALLNVEFLLLTHQQMVADNLVEAVPLDAQLEAMIQKLVGGSKHLL